MREKEDIILGNHVRKSDIFMYTLIHVFRESLNCKRSPWSKLFLCVCAGTTDTSTLTDSTRMTPVHGLQKWGTLFYFLWYQPMLTLSATSNSCRVSERAVSVGGVLPCSGGGFGSCLIQQAVNCRPTWWRNVCISFPLAITSSENSVLSQFKPKMHARHILHTRIHWPQSSNLVRGPRL